MKRLVLTCSISIVLLGLVLGCGSSEDTINVESGWFAYAPLTPATAPTAAPAPAQRVVLREVPGETVVVEKQVLVEVGKEVLTAALDLFGGQREGRPGQPGLAGSPGVPTSSSLPSPAAAPPRTPTPTAALKTSETTSDAGEEPPVARRVSQNRIIVRTVDIELVVSDIQGAIDEISGIADDAGGWVVETDRSRKHRGFISIRVPAEDLDDIVLQLRDMGIEVKSERSTSQDVTDEYVDLNSRLKNQFAAEEALIGLLNRAESVEHALEVQRELTSVQENIERLSGRIKFLEETAAFSLVSVRLSLAPAPMTVDAGEDRLAAAHSRLRFRATFTPPEDIEDFSIEWDFGDGSGIEEVFRTAPTMNESERVTATISHSYDDPKDSPFIVQVKITGTGDAGIAEGQDTLIVTVSEVPVIEVFTDERRITEEGEVVEFSGSFTRPEGLTDVRVIWDFGDGSPVEEQVVSTGVTTARANHVYENYRRDPYMTTMTVTADSEVGEVAEFRRIGVLVREVPGFVVAGFELDNTFKSAVRSLTWVGQWAFRLLIWVAIFSPVWGGITVFAIVMDRRERRKRDESAAQARDESEPSAVEAVEPGETEG